MMKRHLLEYSKGFLQKIFFTLVQDTTIGRDRQNTICLVEKGVSRRHARITFQNAQWVLHDLGSRNGTFVNGERIQSQILKHGDVIGIDRNSLRFLVVEWALEESAALEDTEEAAFADFPQEIREQMDLVKTFLEALPIGVAIINEKMEVRYYNRALALLKTPDSHEEGGTLGGLLGCSIHQGGKDVCSTLTECARCPLQEAGVRVFQEEAPTVNVEIPWQGKGETELTYVRFSMLPLPYRLTGEELAQLTWEDITSRKVAQEALRQAHKELERRVEERTSELIQANEQLKREVEERRRAEKALKISENELRYLSSRLLEVQESERKLIAMDLHDAIGQVLVGIKINLESKLGSMDKEEAPAGISLKDIISMVRKCIQETERVLTELRPSILDELGILATISWFCREFQSVHPNIKVEKQIHLKEGEIPDSLKIVIFRLMQEALSNVAKHSKADLVRISIHRVNDNIEMSIEDNGEGFDLKDVYSGKNVMEKGLGLSSMQERTSFSRGSFSVESARGEGTVIRASWPCETVFHE